MRSSCAVRSAAGPRLPARLVVGLVALATVLVAGLSVAPSDAQTTTQPTCTIALVDDQYYTGVGLPFTVAPTGEIAGVVANDTTCDSGGLVVVVTPPTHGTLSDFDGGAGGFTYTPDPGFRGTDTFTYILQDEPGVAPATVSVFMLSECLCTTTTLATTSTTVAPTASAAVARAVGATPALTG
jgi:hypothetical protein